MQGIEINLFMFKKFFENKTTFETKYLFFTNFLVLLHLKTNLTICLRSADAYQCNYNLILWGKCSNHQEVPLPIPGHYFTPGHVLTPHRG